MIFNSIQYLIFLPLVTFLYYVLPVRYRWVLLLVASFYFYMVWEPIYILLVIISTLVDYYCGLKMGQLDTKPKRKPYMILSMVSNLTILGTFKYYNFFSSSVNVLLTKMNMEYLLPMADLILPLGISFYTFQTMSYSLDIYKGKSAPEKHIGKFALYVTFFPQLVAGPIERAKQLISQFHFKYKFEWSNINSGLRLVMLGMFKKVVIADQLGPLVSHVYSNPEGTYGLSIYIASMLFAQQVYCDFSGYSDIARGSAKMLGIQLMENFELPFYSKNLGSFWARWHVSLMNWFRDYIMFPMIKDGWKWPVVFFIVFLVSGVWHGANWTFVIWGIYNAVLVIYSKATLKWRSKMLDNMGLKKQQNLRHVIQSLCVIHIFGFSSVFFRARNVSDSWILIKNFFTNFWPGLDVIAQNTNNIRQDIIYMGVDSITFYLILLFVLSLEFINWNLRNQSLDALMARFNTPVRFALYTAVILAVVLMSNVAESPFIYFQF